MLFWLILHFEWLLCELLVGADHIVFHDNDLIDLHLAQAVGLSVLYLEFKFLIELRHFVVPYSITQIAINLRY